MSKSKKQFNNKLTITQKKELAEWDKKLKDGTALDEVKKMVLSVDHSLSPKYCLMQIASDIMPKIRITNKKLSKEEIEKISQSVIDYGIENHTSIIGAIEKQYRGLAFNLRKNIIEEYNCQTYSEKALVDMIVNAYARNLSLSRMLVNTATTGHTTPGLNQFMVIMSKEIDRANRHFLTALETLKHFKQPELKVNVKTKNAFIGQNQQFNTNQNDNHKTQSEIIDAK